MTRTNRSSQGPLVRPSRSAASNKALTPNAHLDEPIGYRGGDAVQRKLQIVPPIQRLFLLRRPPYVPRLVVTKLVRKAIKRMLWRGFRPDMVIESHEVVPPLIANGDTTPSVLRVTGIINVVAATFHQLPAFVFGRFAKPMRHVRLACKTTAVGSVPNSQGHAKTYDLVTAFTLAEKMGARIAYIYKTLNGQLPEDGTVRYDDFSWHILSLLKSENVLVRPARLSQYPCGSLYFSMMEGERDCLLSH